MKPCQCCGAPAAPDAPHCACCGEASWKIAPVIPEPALDAPAGEPEAPLLDEPAVTDEPAPAAPTVPRRSLRPR